MHSMSEGLARKALEAAPDATVIIDADGIIRFSNRQTASVFGYGTEIIGMSIEGLLPPRLRSRHVAHRGSFFANVRMRPMGFGLDLLALRKDGTEFPVEVSLSPLEDDDGRMLVAASIRDVTERKRVEAELRFLESIGDAALSSQSTEVLIGGLLDRLRAALHSDTATILLADPDGRYLTPFASAGMESDPEGTVQIPVGKGAAGRIAVSDAPVIFEDLDTIEVLSPVLRSRVRSLVGTALRHGERLVGVVHVGSGVIRTFTQDDARLLSMAAGRISMAIERAQLQESEQAARHAAESANRQKSLFLSTASHDLRQPLQTLSLLNGSLRRLVTDPEVVSALGEQEAAIEVMSRLLNALLDISKLESGAIKAEPVDFLVTEILEELRREFTGIAKAKGLELRFEAPEAVIRSDPALVAQILRNLISNAIKFTPSGFVTVRCSADQAHVHLQVLDTGIGIPPEKLPFIYEEFYQAVSASSSRREGYGLGLSIVHRIVRLLDASLQVVSKVGEGSTFSLTLPAGNATRVPPRNPEQAPAAVAVGSACILLVEDDLAVRKATRMLLKSEGFQVFAVSCLAEAKQELQAHPQIDLLMTDFHLEDGETGLDVIAAVRSVLKRDIKAILVTGDTSSTMDRVSQVPHLCVVSKPVNAERLLASMRNLMASD